jgi:hypothetical protein
MTMMTKNRVIFITNGTFKDITASFKYTMWILFQLQTVGKDNLCYKTFYKLNFLFGMTL